MIRTKIKTPVARLAQPAALPVRPRPPARRRVQAQRGGNLPGLAGAQHEQGASSGLRASGLASAVASLPASASFSSLSWPRGWAAGACMA